MKRVWRQDEGVLTFEWILLITLIVIGIVDGLSAVGDGVIDELGDVTEAVLHVHQSGAAEQSPCDPCQMDFGSFTDPRANTPADASIIYRGRPAAP